MLNRFKQVVYDLIEDIELKILGAYEENGIPGKMAIEGDQEPLTTDQRGHYGFNQLNIGNPIR